MVKSSQKNKRTNDGIVCTVRSRVNASSVPPFFCFVFFILIAEATYTYMSFCCYLQLEALKRVQWNFSCFACFVLCIAIRVARGGSGPFVIYTYLFFISSSTGSSTPRPHSIANFSFTMLRSLVGCECVFGLSRINIFLFFLFFFHLRNYRFAVPMDVYLVRLWYRNVPAQSQYNSYIQRQWFFLFIIIYTEEEYTLSAQKQQTLYRISDINKTNEKHRINRYVRFSFSFFFLQFFLLLFLFLVLRFSGFCLFSHRLTYFIVFLFYFSFFVFLVFIVAHCSQPNFPFVFIAHFVFTVLMFT